MLQTRSNSLMLDSSGASCTFATRCGIPALDYSFRSLLEEVGLRYDIDAPILLLIDAPYGFVFSALDALDRTSLKIIVVTGNTCPEYCQDLWDLHPDILLAGIDLQQEMANAIIWASKNEQYCITPGEATSLTLSERRVLQRLVRGCTNECIANDLSLAPKTVRNMLSTIYQKLGVADRVTATLRYWGMEHVIA